MVRSNWKIPYINLFILRQFLYNEDFYDTISYIWKASGRVFFALINKEFLLNRGNSFSKFDIKQPMFNTNLGEYIISKNMGLSIHERNKKKLKKKKSSKKKKGVLANPLGYRLDLNGNWQDSWSLNTLTYTEFLHSSLKIRKFIISFFEFEKFWKTGILLNNIKIINAQKIMKIYITWYAGKSFDKKKYHFIQWYKRHIFKLIFYFRTWQTRLYWLRYKFNNIERNISNKISKCNYSLIYYNFKKKLNNDKYKKTKLLKLKYTKKGNEIISNLFSNLGSKLKTKLESLLNILISKEKTGAYKLNKKLESNEKKILKYNLRQKKKKYANFSFIKQIFIEISSKKEKWVGLKNLINNKGINTWNLLLNIIKNSKVKEQVLNFIKMQKSYKMNFIKTLHKLKNYLYFLLAKENKDFLLLKENTNKIDIKKWKYFIMEVFKRNLKFKNIIETKDKNKVKLIYFCYYLLNSLKIKKNKINLIKFYNNNIDSFLFLIKNELQNKKKISSKFNINLNMVYNINNKNLINLNNKKSTVKFFSRILEKNFWKNLYELKNLKQFKVIKKNINRNLNWSNFLIWFPRFMFEKLNWKYKYRKNKSIILKRLKSEYEKNYSDKFDWYKKRFINKKLFFNVYKKLKKLARIKFKKYKKIINKYSGLRKRKILFNFYKKLRFSITLNKNLFKVIKSKIFRLMTYDLNILVGPSLIKELWIYGNIYNLHFMDLKNYSFRKNLKAYDFLKYDLNKVWQKHNDPTTFYSFTSTKKFIIDLDNWLSPYKLLRFLGNFFYHLKKENRKENFFSLILRKSVFNYKIEKKKFPKLLNSWSLRRQTFGAPIRRKYKKRNTFANRKKEFWRDFKPFLKDRARKKFGLTKPKFGKRKSIFMKLNSKRLYWTLPPVSKIQENNNKTSKFYLDNVVTFDLYKYIEQKNWKYWGIYALTKKKKRKRFMSMIFWLPWLTLSIATAKFTRNINSYREPFKVAEIIWLLWLNLKKLFEFKKFRFKSKYYKFFLKTWQNLNIKTRFINLKYRIYYNSDFNNWTKRVFWTKWLLISRKNFKSLILKYIKNKTVEKFVIQRTKIDIVRKNANWLKSNSLKLKKKIYNLGLNKISILKDLKLIQYSELKEKNISLLKKKWKFKRLKSFWEITKNKFSNRFKNLVQTKNKTFRRILKSRYWKKRIYYMTHENPFKGYAGHIALHKDYGKYIDFSRGKLGDNINFIKKLINLKIFFKKKAKNKFILRQIKKTFWKLKTKWDFIFKLYVSKNIRRSDLNFKNVRDNYNFIYKGNFYGKLKKRYYKHKKDPRFDIPKRALKTILIKQQSSLENYHTNKIIKDNWWNLKKIKLKFSRLLKNNSNLFFKIPLKINIINKLKHQSINLLKKIHIFKKTKINEKTKLNKLKKIFVFVSKLKQVLLNPYAYSKIWKSLNIFDKNILKQKYSLKRFIRKKLTKIKKSRTNIIYQIFIDNFRKIFENMAKRKLQVSIFSIDNNNINAELLARYIIIKILQKYSFGFLLHPMKKELIKLIKLNILDGFRIRLSGRFTRRQRSKVITLNYGLLPLTEKNKNIDYNERTMVLKFSIMSIKILLCRNSNWIQKKKLQFTSPTLKTDLINKIEKTYKKYTNTVLNMASYNKTIKTNETSDSRSLFNLKKTIISNKNVFENFNRKKQNIFERIFKDSSKIYEIQQEKKFLFDRTVRSYYFVKDFKKQTDKKRWKDLRISLKNNTGNYFLGKKLNNNY